MAVRTIPCICQTAKVTKNVVLKPAKTLEGFFAKMPVSIKSVLGPAKAALAPAIPVTAKSVIEKDGSKCELCGGKGSVDDSTDTRDTDKQAATLAQSKSKEIQDLEAKMGLPGGNRHQVIVGNDLLEVGLGMNDTPSYIIKEGKGFAQTSKLATQGAVPSPIKTNQVVGTNPLSTPGGQYVIKCSNKFSVFSGAQGIEFNSYGPIVFKGGMTKFVGPEITIGSAKGQVTVEGDHLQLNGKSINISPDSGGKGQVNIQGTLTTNGNIVSHGGAHIEGDLSFISATCPMKIDRTRFASTADQATGHAEWQIKSASQGTQDFIRKIQTKVTDPALLQMSPREINNLILETKQLVMKALIIEPVVTGWIIPGTKMLLQGSCPCNYGGSASGVITATVISPIDLRNFPHHHILSDGTHTHDIQVPNIRLMDGDEEVRKTAGSKDKMAPVGTHKDTNLFSAFGPITSVLKLLAVKLVR